jgi:hypothetical protein
MTHRYWGQPIGSSSCVRKFCDRHSGTYRRGSGAGVPADKFTRRGGTESKALQYEKVSAQTAGDIATYPTLWFMPTYYSPRSAPTGPGCKARALA